MSDRCIHARTAKGSEIIRYGRSGKWYAEHNGIRARLTLAGAVGLATQPGATTYLGLPSGMRFDAAVRKANPDKESPDAR